MSAAGPVVRRSALVATIAAALLIADLFLDWERTQIHAGVAAVHIDSATSGWGGWGVAAGLCAIAVIALARRPGAAVAVAGAGTVLFTALATLGSETNVDMPGPMLQLHSGTTLWPAWAGLALAIVVAAATAVPHLVADGPTTAAHPPA